QQARQHFVDEVRSFVRPELFNRIDRIVPFAPLDQATTLQIAHRQLELLQHRDGIRYRGVTLDVAQEVAEHLAQTGYDPRYGARPLKRAIERELLAPLADRMNGYAAGVALAADTSVEQGRLHLTVRARTDDTGRQVAAGGVEASGADTATRRVDLRRR